MLRWTLIKLGRRLAGLSKPKITEDDVIEEVKKKCDKAKIKLDIEFTKYPKHATKLAEAAIIFNAFGIISTLTGAILIIPIILFLFF